MDREKAVPARVVAQSRGVWRVAGNFGESAAEATGKLRLAAEEGADWPAVGDWVAAELQDQGGAAMIREVLPRRSQFVRKMAGKKPAEQVIAAKPVIILNKADACECLEEKVDEIEKVGRGVPVCAVSAKTAQGFEELVRYLGRGQTLVLLGSSGVGKSTIVNRLLGRDLQEVEQVRESDSRGRHTTTARQLFALPGGALLMDTPGLRELQLWDANEGISQTFAEIEAFAACCRFTNCTHGREPGCAVQAAIQTGALDLGRLENWRKVQRELEFLERKIDPEARQNERQRIKRLMRGVRQMYRDREKR